MKLIFTLIALCFSVLLNAQKAGTLDSSFGVNGKVVTDFDSGTSVTTYKGLVQSDDKIIAVGSFESIIPPYDGFFVMRYMPDGSVDSGFGDSGKKNISILSQNNLIPYSACLQKDGKILLAGSGYSGWPNIFYSGFIVRLNTNGSIDSSFGIDGIVTTKVGKNTSYSAIAVQPDGKIIGVASTGQFVDRFFENGSLDHSFGTNGYSFYSGYEIFNACVIQPDGEIIMGGYYFGTTPTKFCVNRFQSNGDLDASFGFLGAITQIGDYDSYVTDIALQSDGKIVAVGSTDNFGATATARYNVDGSLDSTFAKDGVSHDYFPGTFGRAVSVLIQGDNKILLGGGASIGERNDYGLERLTANGLIDSSFGENGLVATDFTGYSGSGIQSLGFQSSGKIVAIGTSANTGYYNISLARYDDDLTKKQIIIQKIKHYIQTHNDAQATTLNKVCIYPNPAQNILHVEGLSANAKLTVVDLNGNIAISQQLSANSQYYNLNIASLHAGNYLLKIETNGEVVTKQFVKE
jgi:uncharacterized delta-60 repeat protein